MTVKELIAKLKDFNPDAPVLVGEINSGFAETYALADYVLNVPYGQILTDLFHTFDGIDERLLHVCGNEDDQIVYIGSLANLRFRDKNKIMNQESDKL